MAVDFFLKLDGIDGESADDKHKNWIDVESWSWGLSNSGSATAGGAGGTGKASFQDLHVHTQTSKASPQLFLACAKGNHIQTATLTCRKSGGDQQDFYIVTLSDVLVSSFDQSGQADDAAPLTENVSFNFAKIEVDYLTQSRDGSLGERVSAGWDLKKNVAV